MNKLFIGQEFSIKGMRYVISHLTKNEVVYHFKRGGPAQAISFVRFEGMLEEKIISLMHVDDGCEVQAPVAIYFSDYPKEQQSEAMLRKQFVEALSVEGTNGEKGDKARTIQLQELALKLSVPCPGLSTVYKWKKLYTQSDGDLRSLVSATSRKGNHKERLSFDILNLLESAISEWLSPERKSLSWVYGIMLGRIVEINSLRSADQQLVAPAFSTLCRRVEKLDPFTVTAARYGKDFAARQGRTRMASAAAAFVMSDLQFDHTPIDLILKKGDVILGKPDLTIALDKKSKAIVGYYLDFEPPSYNRFSQCLKHVLKPKNYVAGRYPGIKNSWNCYGVPLTIFTDNGAEFLSSNFDIACFELEVHNVLCPPGMPWFKASVERFFRTANMGLVHNICGTTKSNIFDKGDYDSLMHAAISFEDFEAILNKWIIDVYMQDWHAGIGTSPAKAWAKGVAATPVREVDSQKDLDILLAANYVRTISSGRIQIENIQYSSGVLSILELNSKNSVTLDVKVNLSDLGTVNIIHPLSGEYVEIPAVQMEYANGLPMYMHKALLKDERRKKDVEIDWDALNVAKKDIAEQINQAMSKSTKKTRKKAARASDWAGQVEQHAEEVFDASVNRIADEFTVDYSDLNDGEEFAVSVTKDKF